VQSTPGTRQPSGQQAGQKGGKGPGGNGPGGNGPGGNGPGGKGPGGNVPGGNVPGGKKVAAEDEARILAEFNSLWPKVLAEVHKGENISIQSAAKKVGDNQYHCAYRAQSAAGDNIRSLECLKKDIQNMKNYLGQRQMDTKKTTITTKTAKTNTTQPKEAKKANPQKAKVVRPKAKAKTEKHREPKATAKKKLS